MRLSTRNQLKGTITEVDLGTVMAVVKIKLDGDRPLEDDFVRWDWSRAALPDGMGVLYDVTPRGSGPGVSLAMRYAAAGGVTDLPACPSAALPPTAWRLARRIGTPDGSRSSVLRTLEDTPFYDRSLVSTGAFGSPVTALHESLSLDRFRAPWVQAMLPFRMPRAPGRAWRTIVNKN